MMNGKSDQGGWPLTQSNNGTRSAPKKASSAITAATGAALQPLQHFVDGGAGQAGQARLFQQRAGSAAVATGRRENKYSSAVAVVDQVVHHSATVPVGSSGLGPPW
jgi:hypothetical protein